MVLNGDPIKWPRINREVLRLAVKGGLAMTKEKFTIQGSQIVEKVKQLIQEGNVRRVRLLHNDRPLIDIPLTVGVPVAAAAVLAVPVLAALGAIAALVTECTIEVERVGDVPKETDVVQGEAKEKE